MKSRILSIMISSRLVIIICLLLIAGETETRAQGTGNGVGEFIRGVDISFLQEIEDHGGIFVENGVSQNALDIFRNHGVNFIRLRLWHTPAGWYNGLDKTLEMAKRIKQYGFGFLLDLHYSQTWADPGHQVKPPEWNTLSFDQLKDSVYSYTFDLISAMKADSTLPDIVQLGNEVTCGMLWPDGHVCDNDDTPVQWQKFADLMNEAVRGTRDAADSSAGIRIMIHIDRGADSSGAGWFFDHLTQLGVDFDIIGLSYYPWWHGDLSLVRPTLNFVANRYHKDVVIVETAYPWTLLGDDAVTNQVGLQSQILAAFPATVDGQHRFLDSLRMIITSVDSGRGAGFFYWSPEHISAPGLGSDWENCTTFDFQGEVLASIHVFESSSTRVSKSGPEVPDKFILRQNFPNPFNPETSITFTVPRRSYVTLQVFNLLGELVATLMNKELTPGEYTVELNATASPDGIYFYRMTQGKYLKTGKMVLVK